MSGILIDIPYEKVTVKCCIEGCEYKIVRSIRAKVKGRKTMVFFCQTHLEPLKTFQTYLFIKTIIVTIEPNIIPHTNINQGLSIIIWC